MASIRRRDLIAATAGSATVMALVGMLPRQAEASESAIEAEEHWVNKGPVRLYVYRKRSTPLNSAAQPVLFLVHGSTFSGRGTYDLIVPGRTGYSAMDHFAEQGFDVWTMDHENYGFSDRTNSNSGILSGVDDLRAALPLIEKVTGRKSVMMFGESSGAIRAGAFAIAEPNRVERLLLHALTYTGIDAPEIERRKKEVDFYKANARRPFGMKQIQTIFDRDVAGKADPEVVKALADFELHFGDSVPTGTYLDMATNMPMVDPKKLLCPVCVIRPEHDGNESEKEIIRFFGELAAREKQFSMIRGLTHAGGMIGSQRHKLWHIVDAFLTLPEAAA